jgi:hypothetical protein
MTTPAPLNKITKEQALSIGGRAWTGSGGTSRVYLQIEEIIGLDVEMYRTGNVRSAVLRGRDVSNCEARRILSSRLYVDDSGLHWFRPDPPRTITAEEVFAAVQDRLHEEK